MSKSKKIGVWMDHANAHLIEYNCEPEISKTIISKFTHEEKEHSLAESEKLMHNKENHEQSDYYKKIAEVIKGYDDVLLFGPTEAKAELFNLIKADHHFSEKRIIVKPSDKLNDHEQHSFVKDHFHTDMTVNT